jgi:4-amino-4-deoxy-L-arabinose transferase-like glycosyltransferase
MSTLEESAPYALTGGRRGRVRGAESLLARVPWGICLVTAVAAALRFASIESVSPNQFYDGAVRSMSLSFHNFFFGAFDPGASLSIDKPPLDLWLQVITVKLFGWGPFSLKLPEALGGTLAVPLLYDAVRRAAGKPAGLAAAAALAVLPESVLTARSDTMDSVMMLLMIAALWLTIRAVDSARRRTVVLAGVALGLAFNVKLTEALVAVPALVVLFAVASRAPWRRKLADIALAGVALVTVGLSWAVVASLAPGKHPWPVGSSDGSVWNAMFVFNGFGKVSSHTYREGGPGLFRLLLNNSWHYDILFGCMLFAALAIGIAAVIVALRRSRAAASPDSTQRLARAFALTVAAWIFTGMLIFNLATTVHPRYLDALAPALAAAIGYGAASLAGLTGSAGRAGAPSIVALAAALAATSAYTTSFKPASIAAGAVALIVAAVGAALIARSPGRVGYSAKWLTVALILASALAFPVHQSVKLIRTNWTDSLGLATASPATAKALSSYLGPRTAGVRYELAVDEPLGLAPLIISDRRRILPLTSWAGRQLTSLAALQAAVRASEVRYGLIASFHCNAATAAWASCGPGAVWIRTHGIDVTKQAGIGGSSRLYKLTPAMGQSSA